MKNIFKICFLLTVSTLAFVFLGTTSAKALDRLQFDVIEPYENEDGEFAYNVLHSDVTSYDIGNIPFGESKVITLRIINSGNDIAILDYGFYKNATSTDPSNSANNFEQFKLYYGDTDIVVNKAVLTKASVLQIRIDSATIGNFARRDESATLILETYLGNYNFTITAQDTSIIVDEPVVNPNVPLTYNGSEQTMDFYNLNLGVYEKINFDYSLQQILAVSGNTATDAGTYTASVIIDFTNIGSWPAHLNPSGRFNNIVYVEWEIKKKIETLAGTSYDGLEGNELSTISLPTGWSWVNPTDTMVYGVSEYEAVYTPTDTNNYETVNENIVVNVTKQYSVEFDLSVDAMTDASSNIEKLKEGESKVYQITANSGYLINSVKINNIEQLKDGELVSTMPININNINQNYEIVATTERIIVFPVEGYDELIIDIKDNKSFEIKFPGEFSDFKFKEVILNGNVITSGFSFKEGSIIMVIEEELLSTLSNGEYNVAITLEDNSLAIARFNILNSEVTNPDTGENDVTPGDTTNPDTGENGTTPEDTTNPSTGDNVLIYGILTLLSLFGLTMTTRLKKNNKNI